MREILLKFHTRQLHVSYYHYNYCYYCYYYYYYYYYFVSFITAIVVDSWLCFLCQAFL